MPFSRLSRIIPGFLALCCLFSIGPAWAKPIEDVFSEMLAIRESDPAGFTVMIVSIGLIFTLAFALMFATMAYYVRAYLKKKH